MSVDRVSYRFECTSVPWHTAVTSVVVEEALNEPYRLKLRLRVDDPDADVAMLLGTDGILVIERADKTRRVCGIIRRVAEGVLHRDGMDLELVLVPALWLLGLRRNTRIFQEMSVDEILEAVLSEGLGPYDRAINLDLRVNYPKREYCVQYGETDLAFVQRLMEEEGISYGFDHEGDRELLVLGDSNDVFAAVPSGSLVRYEPHDLEISGPEPVQSMLLQRRTTTTSVVVRDWDWTRNGDMNITSEECSEDPVGRNRESYEHGRGRSSTLSDYSPGCYGAEDSTHQATVRQQAEGRDILLARGVGRVIGMAPGTTFELTGHPNIGVDGEYLITRVVHTNASADGVSGSNPDPYHNRFECIPVATPYRPSKVTPKPRIPGVQTAVVTGPSGEEIHTDEHGRIKVQFHWDREGNNDENSSCWVRVQQAWAGNGWGFWYLPRIGMEVVVRFVDGDPDRPLVTGCVYNATNIPPYALPAEKTKSTIKSNSSPGGGGSNEFRFEDKAGSEEIYTHAQKDYNEVVENDHSTLVHHDQTITVDNDQTQIIHQNQTETVHGNQVLTVDVNRSVRIKTDFEEAVDGTETRHIVGDVTESFDACETRSISGDVTETIKANETRTVLSNHKESITGSSTQTITGGSTLTTTGSASYTVVGGVTETTPAAYDITAVGGMTITGVAGITLTAPAGIQIVAPGGVAQVDFEFKWVGFKGIAMTGFASAVAAVKIEAATMVIGATGVKIEGTLVELAKENVEMKTRASAVKIAGARLYQAAVLLQTSGVCMML